MSLVVDDPADASDATPGDGTCATAAATCTLRAALEEANALAGHDTINLQRVVYARTIPGDLEVTSDVSIVGPTGGAIIDAAGLGRGLRIHPGTSVTLQRLVIRGGSEAALDGGGGILNDGVLILRAVAVTENTGTVAAGIRNRGNLTAEETGISYNGPGPAVRNDGAAQLAAVDVVLNDGVGLANNGMADLQFVLVDRNAGGGIVNTSQSTAAPAHVDVRNSVLSGNQGLGALHTTGTAALRRSTVSGNRGTIAASAIYVASLGTLFLEDVTVGANGSPQAPQAALDGASPTIRALNTIVAGNASSSGDPTAASPSNPSATTSCRARSRRRMPPPYGAIHGWAR